MALYGVLGDIHGNKEALLAVLALFDRQGVERILCVGDIVGYNADSNACIAILRERDAIAVAGNHDLISTGRLGVDRCSDKAAYALKRTRRTLTAASAAFLRSLTPMQVIEQRIVLVHAGVHDIQLYMRTPMQIGANADLLKATVPNARICFFGHTHEQRVYRIEPRAIVQAPEENVLRLSTDRLYFINPGSVDAARKTCAPAECAIFDSTTNTLTFARTDYDASTAEAKARAGGYRMRPATARWYALRRRVRNRLRRLWPARPPRRIAFADK